MSYPFGISGIGGYSPYMSGLGTLGLGTGSSYGSYGDPSMMGMMGMSGMGMTGMGMIGGMFNPTFMAQMNKAYQDMDKSQLEHTSAMHQLYKQSQVSAYKDDDSALYQKMIEDGSLEDGIKNLATKVREGDSDGICQEFDKLKLTLMQKHGKYLSENSDRLDASDTVRGVIEKAYAEYMTKLDGTPVSFRDDLAKYGECAFAHGFNKNYFGKKQYHDKYTEEAENYIYGTRIDNKSGKDRMESIGGGIGRIAEGGTALAAGYGTGIAATGLAALIPGVGRSLGKGYVLDEAGEIVMKDGKKLVEHTFGNGLSKAGKIGMLTAGLALAGDIIWQMSRD